MARAQPRLALPRRDRLAVLAGLSGVTLLAWLYLILASRDMASMPGMSMDVPSMVIDRVLEIHSWAGADFLFVFLMWAIMMVGMMVPTAAPMTLIYAAVARKAAAGDSPLAPTAVFVAGYLAAWTLFSAGATLAQWGLDQAALLSSTMVSTSPALGAGLLVAAGVWQLTAYKNACLLHCRNPAMFFADHWRPGIAGAFRMGFSHGAYCLGCCWMLMGLLFLGGVMNLLWIALIALFVLLEKVIPHGIGGGRLAGLAMIAAGLLLLTGVVGIS